MLLSRNNAVKPKTLRSSTCCYIQQNRCARVDAFTFVIKRRKVTILMFTCSFVTLFKKMFLFFTIFYFPVIVDGLFSSLIAIITERDESEITLLSTSLTVSLTSVNAA
jgi:hypothetical protein